MAGISNVTIEEFVEEENDDFKRNFDSVFSSGRREVIDQVPIGGAY